MMSTEGKIALGGLIGLGAWLYVCLPLLYWPGEHIPAEILGVRPEWLLSISTIALVWATWRLVKGADKTAERQLRAYVNVRSPKITNLATGVGDVLISIPIRNSGQTPAYDLSIWSDVDSADFPTSASSFDLPTTPAVGRITIGPASEHWYEFSISALTAAELETSQALYVHGKIQYRDAFGVSRRTNFCLVKGGGFGLTGDDLFLSHDGNESD
jgi:hypothetical protein